MSEPAAYTGWPLEARALVERAVDAHGGRDRWEAARSIHLIPSSASGLLLWLKGYGRTFHMPPEFETRPHDRVTIFHAYPDRAQRGRFVNGDVAIEEAGSSIARVESVNHRATFRGPAKYRRWQPLDALYFFGYAVWHYHVLPFSLDSATFRRRVRRDGLDGVEVEFPADVPTHCRRQTIFFGGDGRIVRHDYVAEVIGAAARGCHFWEDYERVAGVLLARRRRVVTRVFGHPVPLEVLRVQFSRVSVSV